METRSQRSAPVATPRRIGAALGTGIFAAGMLIAPAAATASPLAATSPTLCAVNEATLTWGVKESFRSYISGSIANGEWTVSDDMRYETPSFIWDKAEGGFASTLESGSIAFTGAVHFTGHSGAMELDLADPVIEFEGESTAYLVLSMGSTDSADAGGEATTEPVRAAKIDLTGAVASDGTTLEITDAETRLTAEGADAFNGDYGSYVAGEELDPITVNAQVADCSLADSEPAVAEEDAGEEQAAEEEAVAISAPEQSIPWLPIAIGGAALLVIGVTGGMLIAGRGKKGAAAGRGAEDSSTE
ncbi:HtaA domain-containing protein [Leucobacter sp.]